MARHTGMSVGNLDQQAFTKESIAANTVLVQELETRLQDQQAAAQPSHSNLEDDADNHERYHSSDEEDFDLESGEGVDGIGNDVEES